MPSSADDLVKELCPACGLCCNGVLFGDVILERADRPNKARCAGLVLNRRGSKLSFNQPCACFDGSLCRIYADRPVRCRTFECGVLQRTARGEITSAAALKLIAQAKRQSASVRACLAQLGDTDEHFPLNRRYARVVSEPLDLACHPAMVRARSKLLQEMGKLMNTLQRYFLA